MRPTPAAGGELFSTAQPLAIADQGCFYVGGSYADHSDTMSGQMFVQYQVPADLRHAYPLVMVHGGGQIGVGFLSTPDRRPGWADYFVAQGFAVYVVDAPGRGRAQGHDAGDGTPRPARTVAHRVSDTVEVPRWPQAHLHTQWPEGRLPGDSVFDQFYASQVAGSADGAALERLVRHAGAQLLDEIGPSVLVAHSLGAPLGWQIADERPELVRAFVAVEPTGPPVYDVVLAPDGFADGARTRPWGITQAMLTYAPPVASLDELSFVRQGESESPELVRYWLQAEPARQLVNLARVRMAVVSAEASYHAPYDHATSAYLTQAGVDHDFIRLSDHGINGNGHMMMLEKNNLEIAALLEQWIVNAE